MIESLSARIRNLLLAATGAISSAIALAASPNWSVAILLMVLILGGLFFAAWVLRYNDVQDRRIKVTEEERDECRDKLGDVYDKLHRRDVAFAILHTEASTITGTRDRGGLTRLEDLLGEDGKKAQEEADRFLSRVQDARRRGP